MPILHAIILGIVQGLTEFLPISSSGHLILVPELFGWDELTDNESLEKTFDVALHVGTLVAVLWYFRRDVAHYVVAALRSIRTRSIETVDARIAWLLLLSAVPGAIVGALLASVIEDELGDPILIGVNIIVFALVLEWADRSTGERQVEEFHRRDAVDHGRRAGAGALTGRVALGRHHLGRALAPVRPRERDARRVPDEHPDHRGRGALRDVRRVRAGRRHPAGVRLARSSGGWCRPGSAGSSRSRSCSGSCARTRSGRS